MFQTIKSQVPLLEVIKKDTSLEFKQSGENFVIEDEAESGGCPFCSHKGCFRVKVTDDKDTTGFFKCFSCGEAGDVISWRAAFKKIDLVNAARELAEEYKVSLPRDWSPIQKLFSAAANYYSNCLLTTTKTYPELGGKTPLQYQIENRNHSKEVLSRMHVGWSDGGLIEYLEGIGFEEDVIKQSGLRSSKTGKDFFANKLFIYPQLVRARVSHFTMKDPLKRLNYQLPKKFSLNGYLFYNQDSIKTSDTVIIVEGENDLLSCLDRGNVSAVIATIGQLSSEQLDWMRDSLSGKNVLTLFDPDEAGMKYRVKVEKMRRLFNNLAHVLPPEEKDIDDLLSEGKNLEEIILGNVIKVDPKMFDKDDTPNDLVVPWKEINKEESQVVVEASKPSVESFEEVKVNPELLDKEAEDEDEEEAEEVEHDPEFASVEGDLIERNGAYWSRKFVEGEEKIRRLSDFTLKLVNMFIDEKEGRKREVIVTRDDGYRSKPIMIDDVAMTKLPEFNVLIACAADAYFCGNTTELKKIWKEIVVRKSPPTEVQLTDIVGKVEEHNAWVFKNKLITESAKVIDPDKGGIFWLPGGKIGIRPKSLVDEGKNTSSRADIPNILTDLSLDERDEILKGVIENLSKNLSDPGKALTMVAWSYATVYSNFLFDLNRGFPFLFLWGVNGQGKSTVAKWVTQDFFGVSGHGSTSVPNLKTGVGIQRLAAYYSSIPVFIDEVRNDDATKSHLGEFRSYYDRESRIMGTKGSFGVRSVTPASVFVFNGEDQFEDPATRERCIPIRIPVKGRELQESYRWMEANKHLFTGITYHWILESTLILNTPELKEGLLAEIRALDKELHKAGCSQRTAKNWSAIGIFGLRLAAKYMPDFDFKEYLIKCSLVEANYQKNDTTLMQFWELIEGLVAQENPKINGRHIARDGDNLHIWYQPVFRIVQDETRGRFPFSKNAVLSAIKEEPYYISNNRKLSFGLDGTRRTVLTLGLKDAPESIRNIAQCQ